jgi:CheY-like chemotaxis protein
MEAKICYLIDDDDDDREIFETALYQIDDDICLLTAASGTEALSKLSRHENFTPDYIFIDLHMPVVDGKACLSAIKKIARFKDIPVVMYSTSISPKDMDEAYRLGAAAYITKPYNISMLETSLHSFFAQYHPKQQSYEY